MVFRPPADWARREGSGPFIVKYLPAEALRSAAQNDQKLPTWGLVLSHLTYPSNPTPLESFVRQAKEHIAREYKSSTLLEDKELSIGGRPGYRMAFSHEGSLYLKTVVPRTNLECYLLDVSMPLAEESKYRSVAEASIASFRIQRSPLGSEERAAEARMLDGLHGSRVDPGLLGESWHVITLLDRKVGWQHERVTESGERYMFELDVENDFGEGGKDSTKVRGSFSPDGRFQSVESEHTKSSATAQWRFQVTAVLEHGQIKAKRQMNGIAEEKTFKAPQGVLFEDVADVLRRSLVRLGKGSYLFWALSPYADEPDPEFMEVNAPEPLEVRGAKRSILIVFSRVGRRKHTTYYYDAQGAVVRVGGMREAFSLNVSTREEATRP